MRRLLRPPSERQVCETFAPTRLPVLLAGAFLALAGCAAAQQYSYTQLPAGYHWRAVYNRTTNTVVFYGQDPLTLETVYVGPDNRFFIFHHPGRIGPKDLTMHWDPHDAR